MPSQGLSIKRTPINTTVSSKIIFPKLLPFLIRYCCGFCHQFLWSSPDSVFVQISSSCPSWRGCCWRPIVLRPALMNGSSFSLTCRQRCCYGVAQSIQPVPLYYCDTNPSVPSVKIASCLSSSFNRVFRPGLNVRTFFHCLYSIQLSLSSLATQSSVNLLSVEIHFPSIVLLPWFDVIYEQIHFLASALTFCYCLLQWLFRSSRTSSFQLQQTSTFIFEIMKSAKQLPKSYGRVE